MKQYVADAFTDKVFAGNPAAVCLPDKELSDETMQKIAIENNLSETAFAIKEKDSWNLRWFTPGGEVDLVGHATLATAFVIFKFVSPDEEILEFNTKSGILTVTKENGLLSMNMPTFALKQIPVTEEFIKALNGIKPVEAYTGGDTVLVLENEEQVRNAVLDLKTIKNIYGTCFHITAKGKDYDCVTRTFAPKCNVSEDPVCGRGHCHVVPLWSKKLGKKELVAYQASPRSGILYCRNEGARTVLKGNAALFSEAEIYF